MLLPFSFGFAWGCEGKFGTPSFDEEFVHLGDGFALA